MARVEEAILIRATDESKAAFENAAAGIDKVSLRSKNAEQRIAELQTRLKGLQGRGLEQLSVGDVSSFKRASDELNRLQAGLTRMAPQAQTAAQAVAQVTQSSGNLSGALSQLAGHVPGLSQVSSMLGGLGKVGIAAGLATAAVGIGKTAFGLGELAASAERSEKYFTAFSGSAATAAQNLTAIQKATGGALTQQESMQAATKYLSMGLATNSTELEKLAHMAVLLGGDTRTAAQSMEEFALLLANQSILRLDTFGISGAKVRERIEELQKADAGLSREQAFLNAVMEEGSRKVKLLEGAGVEAGTQTDRLRTAWENLRVELGKPIVGVVKIVKEGAIDAVNATANVLKGDYSEAEAAANLRQKAAATRDVTRAESELIKYRQLLASATANGDTMAIAYWQDMIRQGEASLAAARAAYEVTTAIEAQARALQGEQTAWQEVHADLGLVVGIWEKLKANKDPIELQVLLNLIAAGGFNGLSGDYVATPNTAPTIIRRGQEGGMLGGGTSASGWTPAPLVNPPVPGSTAAVQAAEDKRRYEDRKKQIDDIAKAEETAAKKAQSAWDSTFSAMSSQANSFADTARNASKALSPGASGSADDWLKPGKNGPFENLYRAKDVALRGDASQWAKALGMDQETARKVVAEFEAGIMSAGVQALIDKQAIVDRVRLEKLAQETQTAFAEEIAKAAGASTKGIDELLGFTSDKVATGAGKVGTDFKTAVDGDTSYADAGRAAGGSMAAGLAAQNSLFAMAGAAAGMAYIAAFNSAAGIHSPSTEMMKAGRNLVAGLNAGIAAGSRLPTVGIGGRGGGGRGLMVNAPSTYVQGDTNIYNIYSEAAMVTAIGLGRASKAKRLGV